MRVEQRFYTSQFGRFMSADRFKRAAKVNDSGSWNKYVYVLGDPANANDPTGMFSEDDDVYEDEEQDSQSLVGGATLGDRSDGVSCDANGTNCHSSVTVNGDDDDGSGGGNNGNSTGQTWSQLGKAAKSCAAGSFGVGTAVASGAVATGTNLVGTAGKFANATRGTSFASSILSQLFPKTIGPIWAPTLSNPLATSPVLGRVLGRWVPVIGEGVLIIQGAQFVSCLWASDDGH